MGSEYAVAAETSRAAARGWKAIRTRRPVIRVFHEKIGIRNMVIPGARIVMIVVMKFTEPKIVPNPCRAKPSTQRFPPAPGVNVVFASGSYAVHPNDGRALRGEESGDRDQRAEEEQPECEGIQARERHVRRTDLQRHDHVREAREQRCREYQQHQRAVHREQLVVLLLGLDDLNTRIEELERG